MKRFNLIAQEAGLDLVDNVDDQQQGVNLVRREPEPRNGELGLAGGVRIATRLPAPRYWRAQAAAHVFQVALQRGFGDVQRSQQLLSTGRNPVSKKAIDLVDALELAHAIRSLSVSSVSNNTAAVFPSKMDFDGALHFFSGRITR
jgi:hypothetical protein